jgi:hypothetical protein
MSPLGTPFPTDGSGVGGSGVGGSVVTAAEGVASAVVGDAAGALVPVELPQLATRITTASTRME